MIFFIGYISVLLSILLSTQSCTGHLSDLERVLLIKIPWKYQQHDDQLNAYDQKFFSVAKTSSLLQTRSSPKAKRMEYLCMNDTQRHEMQNAMRLMKKTKAGVHNEYDTFVLFHDSEKSPTAHNGPSFILWHRFYLFMFELSLQKFFKSSMLAYWDNRLLSRSGPNPRESVYFSDEFLGEANGEVKSGFAANFLTPNSSTCMEISKTLTRAVPAHMDGLFKEDFVGYLQGCHDYQSLCTPYNSTFETVHGMVHVFVGELMSYLACAPCDPIFYLHHCFVDYMFEQHFRLPRKRKDRNAMLIYPDIQKDQTNFDWYAGDTIMMPFGISHEDMLNSEMFVPRYDTSPGDVECWRHDDCCSNGNTKYLWCNVETRKCVAKMVEGARVHDAFPDAACYCKHGRVAYVSEGVCRCSSSKPRG